jgi:hypothetical protein
MHFFKKTIFFLILLIFCSLIIQARYSLVKEKKLAGYFYVAPLPDLKNFTWEKWFSGAFQEEYTNHTEKHATFRNTLCRIYNQADYSFFRKIHVNGCISGKEGMMYEEDYIKEYTGQYFIGKSTIDKKLEKLKDVYDTLKKKNIQLILVFEPGKASCFPEYIPDSYLRSDRTLSNYQYFREKLDKLGFPYLDLNQYFLSIKDTSRYPLFPKYGMHWSIYGLALALDTLGKYVEKRCGTDLPDIRIRKFRESDSLEYTDNDIGELCNLVFPLPKIITAYPDFEFENAPQKKNLSVLVIADSYYLTVKFLTGDNLFRKEEYWYYNSKVYPAIVDNDNPKYVDKSNLLNKLEEFNAVFLMVSEINLHCGFWNFADEAYHAIHPGYWDSRIYDIENSIRNEREWFQFTVAKAHQQNMPLEKMITSDATFMFYQQQKH